MPLPDISYSRQSRASAASLSGLEGAPPCPLASGSCAAPAVLAKTQIQGRLPPICVARAAASVGFDCALTMVAIYLCCQPACLHIMWQDLVGGAAAYPAQTPSKTNQSEAHTLQWQGGWFLCTSTHTWHAFFRVDPQTSDLARHPCLPSST